MSNLRKSDGSPIWIAGAGISVPRLEKRESIAYGDGQGRALVETGLLETGRGFIFVCTLCGRREKNDQRMPPACTGPSWLDEHPLEPMVLLEYVGAGTMPHA